MAQDYSVPRDEMNFTEYISRLADAALYDTGIQAVWGRSNSWRFPPAAARTATPEFSL